MADRAANGAEATTESPESRLKTAGFVNRVGLWREPAGERLFSTEDAIARLDAGEFPASWPVPIPMPGAKGVAEHARAVDQRIREADAARAQPPEPPPLPDWAMPWAELIAEQTADQLAEKVQPIVRAEIRAALKKERAT